MSQCETTRKFPSGKEHRCVHAAGHEGPHATEPMHHCHWFGCQKPVPPKMWGCKEHWFTLPKPLRDRIWATYRPGQEITKDPSDAYMEAADAVQKWIWRYELDKREGVF